MLYILLYKKTKTGEPRRARDWIASKGVEKFHPVVKGIRDLQSGDNRRERKCIADRFAKNNDVRNHSLRFESPEMRSQTPEPDLHFVGDTHCPCTAHMMVNLRLITRRKNDLAADARQCFRNVRRNTTAFGPCALQDLVHVTRIFCASLFVFTPIL